MHILKTEDPMSIALKYKNWGWGWRYVNIDQNAFVSWHSAQFHAIKYVLKKLKSHGLCTEVIYNPSFNSVQFSSSIMSSCLRPHGQQHTRHSCPSPTPRACSNSCPSSQWFHSTISSSVVPFLLLPSIFPASGSFPMNQFFPSGGQSTGVSASASVFPVNIQDWFPLGLTGWNFLQSKGLSRVFSNTTVQKHQFFSTQLSLWSNSYIHTWLVEKP